MVLLRRALARGSTANLEVTYEDLNHQFVTAAARHLIWEQHMAVLQVNMPAWDRVMPLLHAGEAFKTLVQPPACWLDQAIPIQQGTL